MEMTGYYTLPEGRKSYIEATIRMDDDPATDHVVRIGVGWNYGENVSQEMEDADLEIFYHVDDVTELPGLCAPNDGWRIIRMGV